MVIFKRKATEDKMSRSLDEVKKTMEDDYDPNRVYDANGDGRIDENDFITPYDEEDSVLAKANRLMKESQAIIEELPVENDTDADVFIISVLESNKCSTIGVKMEGSDLLFTCVYSTGPILQRYENYGAEKYKKLCEQVFQLNMQEEYNCSKSVNYNGVKARVFAIMPPLTDYPNITISTTKKPPSNLNIPISEELLYDLVHSNFIICGASGSGKTYLTNYLLSKYIGDDERIAFVEEFSELNPPNDYTISIVTPPAKPNNQPLLKFVTEQSNLMRLDAVYVGEVKGAEAFPMIVNMASGTRGGCTIHGTSPRQALARLRTLCQLGANNISAEAIDEFIAKSIKYVVQMEKHKITYIGKLTGTAMNGSFTMNRIYGEDD